MGIITQNLYLSGQNSMYENTGLLYYTGDRLINENDTGVYHENNKNNYSLFDINGIYNDINRNFRMECFGGVTVVNGNEFMAIKRGGNATLSYSTSTSLPSNRQIPVTLSNTTTNATQSGLCILAMDTVFFTGERKECFFQYSLVQPNGAQQYIARLGFIQTNIAAANLIGGSPNYWNYTYGESGSPGWVEFNNLNYPSGYSLRSYNNISGLQIVPLPISGDYLSTKTHSIHLIHSGERTDLYYDGAYMASTYHMPTVPFAIGGSVVMLTGTTTAAGILVDKIGYDIYTNRV